MTIPARLVYSSVPADDALQKQLSAHLSTLVQNGLLSEWYEQYIPAGADLIQERQRAWQAANVLLILLSSDYLASETFDSQQMQQALERQRLGQLLIVPVLLRPCDWQATSLGHLQCLPRNGKPVSMWENRDDAFFFIEQDLRRFIAGQRLLVGAVPPLTSDQRTNRQRLLKRVRALWVDGMLQQSLQHAIWVDLHLQKQSDALDNPWSLMVQELDREPRPLPPGTSILQILDEADEELLILGEPGAGKTTLLLYLARTLLDQAEQNERRRIPVIFNLSSWSRQRLPLNQWLLDELSVRYQVPRKVGQTWLEMKQIFPLLDGLDEVSESARMACVQAITAFVRQGFGNTPLIICCRTEEYNALSARLPLQYAVMLLPFSDDQIEVYLSSISGSLDSLRGALHEDKDLFELARKPLMLSIFVQAYRDESSIDLPATTAHEEYPRALFREYVKHMFKRRGKLQRGSEDQMRRWLTYFAKQLHQQQQTLFAVEELQPSWLPERSRPWYRWSMTLVYGLTFSFLGGPLFCLVFGCIFGLIHHKLEQIVFGAMFGLVLGLMGGLSGGLVFGLTFRHHQTIQPAEIAVWSWSSARKGLIVGSLGGLVFGLIGGIIGWLIAGTVGGILVICAVGCIIALVSGLVGGLSPTQMPERISLSPNEGIWRSGKRGLVAVLLFILVVALAAGLLIGLLGESLVDLVDGLVLGLIFGSAGGLTLGLAFTFVGGRTGIAAFLQHFVLRFFLSQSGLLPWRLVAFLDEATERLLLRKVGGSYIFVHRLLRDTLATPDPSGEK